jgi:hypothetical protein
MAQLSRQPPPVIDRSYPACHHVCVIGRLTGTQCIPPKQPRSDKLIPTRALYPTSPTPSPTLCPPRLPPLHPWSLALSSSKGTTGHTTRQAPNGHLDRPNPRPLFKMGLLSTAPPPYRPILLCPVSHPVLRSNRIHIVCVPRNKFSHIPYRKWIHNNQYHNIVYLLHE